MYCCFTCFKFIPVNEFTKNNQYCQRCLNTEQSDVCLRCNQSISKDKLCDVCLEQNKLIKKKCQDCEELIDIKEKRCDNCYKLLESRRKYVNRENRLEYEREYYKQNRVYIREKQKEYYKQNKERILENYKQNRENRLEYEREYYKKIN